MAGKPVPGQISALFQHIAPGLDRGTTDVQAAVEANVRTQVQKLREGSTVLPDLVARGVLEIRGAVYDLASGRVRELT
jgi:carbonic anhydrase